MGEKMAIVASYGRLLLEGVDVKDGGRAKAYQQEDRERTKLIRGLVQEELENWTLDNPEVKARNLGTKHLMRSKTDTRYGISYILFSYLSSMCFHRSFGVTHATELASMPDESAMMTPHHSMHQAHPHPVSHDSPSVPHPIPPVSHSSTSPPRASVPVPVPVPVPHGSVPVSNPNTGGGIHGGVTLTDTPSPPIPLPQGGILPTNLNFSPPELPPRNPTSPASPPIRDVMDTSSAIISPMTASGGGEMPLELDQPTMAETGKPIEGTGGPSTGSLVDRRKSSGSGTGGSFMGLSPAQIRAQVQAQAQDQGHDHDHDQVESADEMRPSQAALAKALEAQEERLRAQQEMYGHSQGNLGGVDRMATTSRRRMEQNEGEFGGGGMEDLPAYSEMEEQEWDKQEGGNDGMMK
jgi:hypothetical protein